MELSYETAAKLKAAGFPQHRSPDVGSREYVCIPTLAELIGACTDFEALTKEHSQAGDEWVASSFHRHLHGRGRNPEEAVAKLYLKENYRPSRSKVCSDDSCRLGKDSYCSCSCEGAFHGIEAQASPRNSPEAP